MNEFINCMSIHVIYQLICPCGKIYIGQNKRNLKLRIDSNMDYAIARHYKVRCHGSSASLKFLDLEKISPSPRGEDMKKKLLQREAFWIYTLNSMEPHGLNETLDLRPFL